MNRPLARRAGPFLAASAGLLLSVAAGTPRAQHVAAPPPVQPGAPNVRSAGLQGLMDIVLHPRFAENRFIYISYHKPVPTGRTLGNGQPELAGESTLARGVWDGKAITNLMDIFVTGAATESSRMAFGRDGMLYMTVSAPGTNGHSLVVNPETGDLWMTEQGPNGGDEINVLKAGRADFEQPAVLTSENPGAVLRLEPVEATTTR